MQQTLRIGGVEVQEGPAFGALVLGGRVALLTTPVTTFAVVVGEGFVEAGGTAVYRCVTGQVWQEEVTRFAL